MVEHFIDKFEDEAQRIVRGVSPEAAASLQCYAWPGNVCEVDFPIYNAMVMGSADLLRKEDLPEDIVECPEGEPLIYKTGMREAKRRIFRQASQRAIGDAVAAAVLLDLHPKWVRRGLKEMGINYGA